MNLLLRLKNPHLWWSDDTGGGGGDIEPPPPPADPAPAPTASPPADSAWNGELETLEREVWYQQIPEPIRPAVRGGIENKLKTYDKGYQEKFRGLSEKEKSWQAERAKLESQAKENERQARLYTALFAGEQDPRLVEAEANAKKWEEERAAWEQERAALRGELDQYTTRAKAAEEAEIAREVERIRKEIPDIVGNPEAWKMFDQLMTAGLPEEKATKLVRAEYPVKKSETVPDTVTLAHNGYSQPSRSVLPAGLNLRDATERAAARTIVGQSAKPKV